MEKKDFDEYSNYDDRQLHNNKAEQKLVVRKKSLEQNRIFKLKNNHRKREILNIVEVKFDIHQIGFHF